MKSFFKYISFSMLAAVAGLTACHNGDIEFDDYEGGVSVSFPYQTPVRVLEMGEDEHSTERDNAHKCWISTTMGGSYKGKNITVNIDVDESLCANLYKEDSVTRIEPMPASYYMLSSKSMQYDGNYTGHVEVTFSDAFFEDSKSVSGNYVIPVVITSQTGADRILSGEYDKELFPTAPSRLSNDWNVAPKDYSLFCVRYISKYEGYFLRGVTNLNGEAQTREAGKTCIDDPIVNTKTISLNKVSYTASVNGADVTMILTFDESQKCSVSAPEGSGNVISGTGEYKDHSEIKAWGNKDRDGLYLNYTVDGYSVSETLVLQRRGVTRETFKYVVKP